MPNHTNNYLDLKKKINLKKEFSVYINTHFFTKHYIFILKQTTLRHCKNLFGHKLPIISFSTHSRTNEVSHFKKCCMFQVAFTMGVLIGISLCIARGVLRKSAARNLEVLVYIGAMLALVSALLLGVQYNARNSARKRRKAVRNAKRGPIPLEILPSRVSSLPGPVIVDETQRYIKQLLKE